MLLKFRACGVTNGRSRQESTELAEVAAKTKPSSLSYDELCGEVQETLKKCDAAKTAHSGKRSAKAAASAYNFGYTIEHFLKDFPELLGPVHALDNQYGGVIFPAVVSSKPRYEEQLQSQLDGLLDQFRYLQKFEKIYRSRRDEKMQEEGKALQNLLKPVFGGVADFLNATTDYYESKHGYIRYGRAITSSTGPNLDSVRNLVQRAQEELAFLLSNDARETRNNTMTIVAKCDDLKNKNAEISGRCTELNVQNVEISKQCTELRNQNIKINKQLQEQQGQLIKDRLSSLMRQLDIKRDDEANRKKEYAKWLLDAFYFNQKQVPDFDDALRHLEKDRAFTSWVNSPSSAVVVLSGHSSAIQPGQRFCWLSAAAIRFIDRKRSSECPIAFFHGQLSTTMQAWYDRSTDKEALHSIIVQIAGLDPCCLQTIDFQQQVEHKDWGISSLETKVALLQELLDVRPASEPVYLVFDNVGAAQGTPKDNYRGPASVLLRRLAEMVRDTKAVVKIMFVGLNTDFGENEVDLIRDTVEGLSSEQLLSRCSWDSAVLPRWPFV
ncbi:MAG: hypothetical protein Q9204_003194 [Flavoplaca sp. TL-2023a]